MGKLKLTKDCLGLYPIFPQMRIKIQIGQGQIADVLLGRFYFIYNGSMESYITVRTQLRNTVYMIFLIKLCNTALPLCLTIHCVHACLARLDYEQLKKSTWFAFSFPVPSKKDTQDNVCSINE